MWTHFFYGDGGKPDSVTDNSLVVTREFPRPQLTASRARSITPYFSRPDERQAVGVLRLLPKRKSPPSKEESDFRMAGTAGLLLIRRSQSKDSAHFLLRSLGFQKSEAVHSFEIPFSSRPFFTKINIPAK